MRARHGVGPGAGSLQPAEDSFRQRRARGAGGTCGLERGERAESVLEASGESRVETELPDH